eukprot:10287555-Lingulodinium_polyedra.AAC.1
MAAQLAIRSSIGGFSSVATRWPRNGHAMQCPPNGHATTRSPPIDDQPCQNSGRHFAVQWSFRGRPTVAPRTCISMAMQIRMRGQTSVNH